jgi:hypothetical protein
VLTLAVLAAWGYGMFHLVLWRLELSLGPAPERTVLTAGQPGAGGIGQR